MKKNFIILAHKNFNQLNRLINILVDGNSNFIIHLDLSADIAELKKALINSPNVFYVEDRIDCIWGDFSIVQATVNGIKFIIESKLEGYTILMSGQDYPIKSPVYINNYLEQNKDYNHISIHRNPVSEDEEVFYKRRLKNYNFFLSKRRGDAKSFPYFWSQNFKDKIKTLLFILQNYQKGDFIRIFYKKRLPFKDFYQGHQWWAFNFETLKKVHRYMIKNENELKSFFRYVTVPDEFFFHTIIKNMQKSDPEILIKNSFTVNLAFNHDESHFETLIAELPHKLFARKFDDSHNTKIFDMLDESFLSRHFNTK